MAQCWTKEIEVGNRLERAELGLREREEQKERLEVALAAVVVETESIDLSLGHGLDPLPRKPLGATRAREPAATWYRPC